MLSRLINLRRADSKLSLLSPGNAAKGLEWCESWLEQWVEDGLPLQVVGRTNCSLGALLSSERLHYPGRNICRGERYLCLSSYRLLLIVTPNSFQPFAIAYQTRDTR
jgi:hypothetical protein